MGKNRFTKLIVGIAVIGSIAVPNTFPVSENAGRIAVVEVVEAASSKLATPTVSKKTGTYKNQVSVTIKNTAKKGAIYYTTNGKTPTAKSKKYTKALTIKKTTTLKVICISGSKKSSIVTRTYTIKKPISTIHPVDADADSTYSKISKYINALAYNEVASLSATDQKICQAIQKILASEITDSMTTEEKAKAIHDYLINNTTYDIDNYNAGTIPKTSYKVEGVLIKKKAVCQGYAETYFMFMQILDIPCKMISGTGNGEPHAWNLVQLSDGKWYHIDCTWDDPIMQDRSQILRYDYFFLNDTMMGADHAWETDAFPACNGTKYLYYAYGDYKLNSISEFESAVRKAYQEGKDEVTVLYPEEGEPDLEIIFEITGQTRISYTPARRLGDYTIFSVKLR